MIRLDGVTKAYGGPLARLRGERVLALAGVTLAVEPGSALGLIGPNGAGKSTLLRILLGYASPSSGSATVAGMSPRAYAERHGIAYVPERVTLPPAWTVRGALDAFAALGEVDDAATRVPRMLDALGLTGVAGRRIASLSKGNLQRLALAQALLPERRVMVLDEGTEGLDPWWTGRLLELVADWRAADPERVLVFASHDLEAVERACERAAILVEGRILEIVDARSGEGRAPERRSGPPTLRERYADVAARQGGAAA
jgi:ABC-2 type transport system ATP-binding protein